MTKEEEHILYNQTTMGEIIRWCNWNCMNEAKEENWQGVATWAGDSTYLETVLKAYEDYKKK